MKTKINYPAIVTFYAIAILLRYLTNKTNLLNNLDNAFVKTILQGIGPAIGAIVAFYCFRIKPVMTLKGNYKNAVLPFLLFWGLPIAGITIVAYCTKGTLPVEAIFAILVYGLLEELGWRGFLQQELKKLPTLLNITIVTVLWFTWHLNFEPTSANLFFFLILFLGSWGIGKVADKTYSLFAVAAFHSLNNFFGEMNHTTWLIIAGLLTIWISAIILKDKIKKPVIN